MSLRVVHTSRLAEIVARLEAVAAPAGLAAAEIIKTRSQELVPVDTGDLRGSAQTDADGHEAAVSYGTDDKTKQYAVVQHEALHYNHPNGGQAKYLEAAVTGNSEEAVAAMAAAYRGAL